MDPSPAKADIIYVARTDTANRVAENEADIMDLLEEEGICVVMPGRIIGRTTNQPVWQGRSCNMPPWSRTNEYSFLPTQDNIL